jgi:vanW-like protein
MMNLKQLLCSVLIGSCLFTSGCSLIPTDGTITYGLYYEDQDISGYSRDAVSSLIHTDASNNKTITITIPNQGTRQVKVKDLGITLDTASTESNIFTYGYEDDLKMLIMHRITAFIYKVHINPVYKLDEVTAKAYFTELAIQIDVSGHDALLTVENGQVKMTPSKEGKRVDIDETIKQLNAQLEENDFNNISIEFTSKDTVRVTNDDVKPLTAVLGSYTTNFDASNTNRTHNIELASTKISGTLVKPGEVFSFNDVVGERTAEAGYDDAPVIIDGKLVPGIGGGICQVSSTLFNTALLSGMNIIERTPHFEPVSYIPAGRDATVAYGYLDFQFKNPYAHNIYVLSVMNNGELTIYIIGVPEDVPKSVSISVGDRTDIPNQTITKIDPSAKEDSTEEGHIGFRINTYRTITYGNWVTTTDVFESTYDPVDTIITKKPAAPEPAKKDSPKSKTKR